MARKRFSIQRPSVPNMLLFTKFHQNWTIFRGDKAILTISNMAAVYRAEFSKFRVYVSRDLYCYDILL